MSSNNVNLVQHSKKKKIIGITFDHISSLQIQDNHPIEMPYSVEFDTETTAEKDEQSREIFKFVGGEH